MQTTQGQHPQYSLPVVQPQLAPPPRPNVKEGYKSHSVRQLAIAQAVLGCFAFGFQLWDIINMSNLSVVGAGIWSGVFFIITGCLGLVSANQKTVCLIVSYMVMSIFSSFLAIALLVVSSINLDYYNMCTDHSYQWYYCRYLTDYMTTSSIFLSSMLVLISVAEGIMAVVASCFTCHGCCCSTTNQGVLSYAAPTQYVQAPNGQLMIVTGPQPQLMTTMTGQQVLIAANPGGYQTPAPYGNYLPQGIPGQPYMTTVPAMMTQQPVAQPDSVQPPAYQQTAGEEAAGTQQPQVHQSAANGKTNTAYVDN